jgi:hypothetical protein
VLRSAQRGFAGRIAECGVPVNFGGVELLATVLLVVAPQGRAAQIGFDTTTAPAIAGWQRQITGFGQRQRIVSPFTSDGIGSGEYLAVNDKAATNTGAEDDAEYNGRTLGGAINRFRERKTVGVIGQPDFTPQKCM